MRPHCLPLATTDARTLSTRRHTLVSA
nr:TPA_asm: m74.7 sORF 1 [Murid betaherpesvirus 1]DBA07829.1 TPA_asm: m74.7 sORF 1 [Murid betaherpesvirus 1]